MDLSDLRVFQAVATQGGITRAAEVLHRVPSNVSTRLKSLEDSLGVELFARERKRMQLSPRGKVLLDYANRLLNLAEEARGAMLDNAPRGILHLGSMESTAAIRLPQLMMALHEQYPALSVELRTGAPRPLMGKVLAGELDAAFVAEPVSDSRLASVHAFTEELVLIGPAGHPPVKTAHDLRNGTLLVFEPDCPHRQRLEAWCLREEMAPRRVVEVGSYHAMLGCCAAGMGVALVPASVLETYSERDRLSIHRLKGKNVRTANTLLVWRKASPQPKVSVIADLLKKVRLKATGTSLQQRGRAARSKA